MNHDTSVQKLHAVVAPYRATGWFIRGQTWALGYWKDGQRIELARGGNKQREVERTFKEAARKFRAAHGGQS